MRDVDCVSLDNIARGAAVEMLQDELEKVLANVADPNTDWKTTRKITLEFRISTNEAREIGDVKIVAGSKLAGRKSVETVIYMGRVSGRLVAVEHNPKQGMLFDKAVNGNVVPMSGKGDGA